MCAVLPEYVGLEEACRKLMMYEGSNKRVQMPNLVLVFILESLIYSFTIADLPSIALVATSTRLDQSSEAAESGTGTLVPEDGLGGVSAVARGDNLEIHVHVYHKLPRVFQHLKSLSYLS